MWLDGTEFRLQRDPVPAAARDFNRNGKKEKASSWLAPSRLGEVPAGTRFPATPDMALPPDVPSGRVFQMGAREPISPASCRQPMGWPRMEA